MFYQNRFTERARQALTLAQEAAASFGHSYICCSACCVKAAARRPRRSLPQA